MTILMTILVCLMVAAMIALALFLIFFQTKEILVRVEHRCSCGITHKETAGTTMAPRFGPLYTYRCSCRKNYQVSSRNWAIVVKWIKPKKVK